MRDYCVEKLCKIDNSHYTIEIYGNDWEYNTTILKYYKGSLKYGSDIAKVYNSATYGYCAGGYVLMQRTLECSTCDTIPLVLDVRDAAHDEYDKVIENCFEFFYYILKNFFCSRFVSYI